LLDLELQEQRLVAQERSKIEADFRYRTKALEIVKGKLQKQPDLEIETEFEKIVSELANADLDILDAEENDTNLVEINERIQSNKNHMMKLKLQAPETYYQKIIMVEEEALKTINKINETERELRILENDNISKPGIAKKLKELEKRGKMCDEELLRYMERCDSFSLGGHEAIKRKRKMVVKMMDQGASQCGNISTRIQDFLPRLKRNEADAA